MTNQNWYLQAHYHAQTAQSGMYFNNLQSGTVTDDAGNQQNVNEGTFPVYRLVCKLTFDTTNMASNSYFRVRFGGNAGSWDGVNIYSGDWLSLIHI